MAHENAHSWIAAELLLACAGRETLWWLAPAEHQGDVSKLCGAALVLILLDIIRRLTPGRSLDLSAIIALAASYQALTLFGMAAYIADPWPIPPGEGVIEAWIGFDLGAVWLLFVAALACRLAFVKGNA